MVDGSLYSEPFIKYKFAAIKNLSFEEFKANFIDSNNIIITDNGVIEVDEQEAEMIKQIFQLRADGFGCTTIAKYLSAQGYCSRNGTAIGQSTISKIIRNTIYYGTMTMNKKHYDFVADL